MTDQQTRAATRARRRQFFDIVAPVGDPLDRQEAAAAIEAAYMGALTRQRWARARRDSALATRIRSAIQQEAPRRG